MQPYLIAHPSRPQAVCQAKRLTLALSPLNPNLLSRPFPERPDSFSHTESANDRYLAAGQQREHCEIIASSLALTCHAMLDHSC